MSEKVLVEISARHVHLSKEHLEVLFGAGHELTHKKDLSQPGQYACNEQVILKGTKGVIERVRILGPERGETQVEISKTDSFALGINPPVRNSGDLEGAAEITIIGPKGEVTKNAAIIAARHIHATKEDAVKYGFENKEFIKVVVNGEKGGILENVYVRISDSFSLEVHLDTDDANAFLIKNGDEVDII
jgi:putative phosphotransacetylase